MKLFNSNIVPYESTEGCKIYPIVVDIKKGFKSGELISFVTADNQVGVISMELIDGNSPYVIEGNLVTATIHRPDDSVLEMVCENVEGNIVTIELGVNGTFMDGVHTFDIKIHRGDDKIVGIPTMSYTVHKSLSSDGCIEEEDKLPIISNLTNEVIRLNGEWDAFTDKFGDIDWEEMQNMGASSVTVNGTKYTQVDGNIVLPSYPTLSSLGAEPRNSNIQAHISSTHAPSNAQKNSDITKAEIEAKLIGNITTHTHNQYLTQHQDLSHLALKAELHNHSNKSVLDNITSAKVAEWNSKSTFNGNYNSLTNKPTIPTKTSELTNDSKFITSIPSEYVTETELNAKGYLTEHQDISNKVDKVSGKGLSTNDYTTSEKNKLAGIEAGANNVKVYTAKECTTFTSDDGTCTPLAVQKAVGLFPPKAHEHSQYLTEHQDISGKADKSELNSLTLGVHTDGMIYLFKNGQPIGNGVTQSTQSGDVVGYVDSENNIVLSGKLADGTYKLKYEMEDGKKLDVGSVTFTSAPFTNLADPTSPDWLPDHRLSFTTGEARELVGHLFTNFIPAKAGDVIRVKGLDMLTYTAGYHLAICGYKADKSYGGGAVYTSASQSQSGDGAKDMITVDGDIQTYTLMERKGASNSANSSLAYIRIDGVLKSGYTSNDVIITVNEEIVSSDDSNKPSYTNQIPLSVASDGTPFNGGQGWKTGFRMSLSSGGESSADGCECTGFIPVPNYNAVIRLKNVGTHDTDGGEAGHYGIVGYDKNFNKLPNSAVQLGTMIENVSEDGVATLKGLGWATHFASTELAYVRISSRRIDESSIITVNEPIV